MKILFLAHNFPPETSPTANRTYEHAKHWVKMGHRVEVITNAPNHPAGILYDGYRNAAFQRENIDGIDVVRVWTALAANKGVFRRSLGFASYFLSATAQSLRLDRPDIVVSSSPQLLAGLAGFPVSRMKRTPWVLEIRDLWPESIVAVDAMSRGPALRILESIERFAYRRADHVIPVTQAFRAHIEAAGVDPARITVLRNAVNLDLFSGRCHNPALAAELGLVPVPSSVAEVGGMAEVVTPDGTLAFSWRLVMAPAWVTDYVVAHEVAHLREMNHSARFWSLVEGLTPHREAAVEWLRAEGPAWRRVG